jgi:hypothetical protein
LQITYKYLNVLLCCVQSAGGGVNSRKKAPAALGLFPTHGGVFCS